MFPSGRRPLAARLWHSSVLFAALSFTPACEPALPTAGVPAHAAPEWGVGDSWTVAVKGLRQQEMAASSLEWSGEKTFVFTVNGEGTIDGIPAYRVAVADVEAGDNYLVLYFRADDRGLIRIEETPRNRRGGAKLVTHNLFGEAAFPVVTDEALVGLNLPAFGRGEGVFSYDAVLEGVGGFGNQVEQYLARVDGGVEYTLRRGDSVVRQVWLDGEPWFSTQDVNGRLSTRLVSFERKASASGSTGSAATSADRFAIDTFAEGAHEPVPFPLSGEARFVPWAFPAIPNPDGEASGVWSGHWWPMLESATATTLYKDGGPMQKYDTYVQAKTGTNPGSKAWEHANHRTTDSKNTWWGHCNGLAAASILEEEPKVQGSGHGVTFTVGDKKGLLTELNNGGGLDMWVGSRNDGEDKTTAAFKDVVPYDFHRTIVQWIGINREPIVIDANAGPEVWNYPVYKYRMTTQPHATDAKKLHVTATVWMVNFASVNSVGVTSSQATYRYWLTVDANGNPIAGPSEWEGSSVDDHPDFMWHPHGRGTGNPITWTHVREIVELGAPSADDHPNTASATGANDVISETPRAGVFETAGDVDYFKFDAALNTEYTLLTSALAGGADTFIHLVDRNGSTELRSDDDSGVERYSSKLIFTPTAAGTYYVRVRHYSSTGLGSYKIALTKRTLTPSTDDHPNTKEATGANDVITAAGVGGSIETNGDVDFFRFDAVSGKTYTIETFNLSTGMDTLINLYGPDGASKQDDDSGSAHLASKIVWTAGASGPAYVRVKHYSSTKTGTYSIKVTAP